mmetsp:Transcript_8686/g.36202  ORF Transcript_8686/g.36202 Transcript_8686/m.36202 type:complete len:234 (+) Transcript_8686:1011-1712(+)
MDSSRSTSGSSSTSSSQDCVTRSIRCTTSWSAATSLFGRGSRSSPRMESSSPARQRSRPWMLWSSRLAIARLSTSWTQTWSTCASSERATTYCCTSTSSPCPRQTTLVRASTHWDSSTTCSRPPSCVQRCRRGCTWQPSRATTSSPAWRSRRKNSMQFGLRSAPSTWTGSSSACRPGSTPGTTTTSPAASGATPRSSSCSARGPLPYGMPGLYQAWACSIDSLATAASRMPRR